RLLLTLTVSHRPTTCSRETLSDSTHKAQCASLGKFNAPLSRGWDSVQLGFPSATHEAQGSERSLSMLLVQPTGRNYRSHSPARPTATLACHLRELIETTPRRD